MSAELTVTLRNGVAMPAIGFGCYSGWTDEEQKAGWTWVAEALKTGYKALTLRGTMASTESALAKAIKKTGVDRKNLFITTKLNWNQPFNVQAAFEQSLKDLNTDYIDLYVAAAVVFSTSALTDLVNPQYLIHWPFTVPTDDNGKDLLTPAGDMVTVDKPNFNDTWAEFEKLYESGRVRAIGVSNFSIKILEQLQTTAKILPHINQVEMHPYLAQPELKAYCDAKGIKITAYTATGYDVVRSDATIGEITAKYQATPAQIILAWHLKRGVTVAVKSASAQRQKENLNLPTLKEEDFETISKLDRGERLCNKPNERGIIWAWTEEQLGW